MKPVLVVITDFARAGSAEHVARIQRLVERARPGSVMLQLRDHQLGARQRLEQGRVLRKLTEDAGQWLAINDRLDLWKVLGADGVHLGEGSVDASEARTFGARWISRALHETESTLDVAADAFVLSPIVEARHGRPALGLEALTLTRARLAGRSLFALGGVSATTARECLARGADGVAVVGAALDSDDATPLLRALDIGR